MWLPVASCGFLQLHQVRRPPVDTFETFDIAPMSGKPVGHDSFVGFPAGFLVGFWLSLWRNCSFFRANLGNYLLWCWWSCPMWFSRGLFSQQLPTHSDFWNYREFACFSCGNCCPFTIMVHHLSRLATALFFILPSYSCACDSSISLSFIAGIRKPRN